MTVSSSGRRERDSTSPVTTSVTTPATPARITKPRLPIASVSAPIGRTRSISSATTAPANEAPNVQTADRSVSRPRNGPSPRRSRMKPATAPTTQPTPLARARPITTCERSSATTGTISESTTRTTVMARIMTVGVQ